MARQIPTRETLEDQVFVFKAYQAFAKQALTEYAEQWHLRCYHQLDKDLPLEKVRTLTYLADSALQQRRLSVELVGGFAGIALLLTAIGLYGMLAYNVGQRSREIGIRMALGAQRTDVLSLVIGHGIRLTITGVALGLVAALILTRVMSSVLYEVKPSDPMTYAAVSGLLLAVGFLACWLPARRATRVDPMEVLRFE
jgi:ABC-type antimicrobial peptide transport system permease subunit